MNQGILERLRQSESAPYIQFIRGMIHNFLHGHRAVFTHGDLQPKNIIVNRIGTHEDGSRKFEISLIDWEIAAWYPEYWKFCSSTIACRWKPCWLEIFRDILHQYPAEYLLMQVIYSTVHY
jgi:serine/threonine protein kinase